MKSGIGLILGLVSTLALAVPGGIGEVKIVPNPARAGQEVTISVSADGDAPTFCGMLVHFGDGSESRNFKINTNASAFPVTFGRTFAKAGTYEIRAEGKKVTTHLPCIGNATAKLVVEASTGGALPVCPEGFKLVGKPGKAGDFSCRGGKEAKVPAKPLSCPSALEYFYDHKARHAGCRKPKAKKAG